MGNTKKPKSRRSAFAGVPLRSPVIQRRGLTAHPGWREHLVEQWNFRLRRDAGGGSLLTANTVSCLLLIDEESEARELMASGLFRTVERRAFAGARHVELLVPAAEMRRFLKHHGKAWFAGRLERTIEGLRE